jgi:hypothetical protein
MGNPLIKPAKSNNNLFSILDGKTKLSSSICVAILHTPFILLLLATVVMIGLVLATAATSQQQNFLQSSGVPSSLISESIPCLQEGQNGLQWPDQIFPYFVMEK